MSVEPKKIISSKISSVVAVDSNEGDRYSLAVIVDGSCTICKCIVPDAQKEMHLKGKKHAEKVFYDPKYKSASSSSGEKGLDGVGGSRGGARFSASVDCPPAVAGHVIGLKGAGLIEIQEKVGNGCAVNRNRTQGPQRKAEGICAFFVQANTQDAADEGARRLARKITEAQRSINAGKLKASGPAVVAAPAAAAPKQKPSSSAALPEKKNPKPESSTKTPPPAPLAGNKRDRQAADLDDATNSNKKVEGSKTADAKKSNITGAVEVGKKTDEKKDGDEWAEERAAKKRRLEVKESAEKYIVDGVCTVCHVKVMSAEFNLVSHLTGKKHLRQAKQAGSEGVSTTTTTTTTTTAAVSTKVLNLEEKEDDEQPGAVVISSSKKKTGESKEGSVTKKDKVKKPVPEPNAAASSRDFIVDGSCTVCKVKVFAMEANLLAHLTGKKHLKNVQVAGVLSTVVS